MTLKSKLTFTALLASAVILMLPGCGDSGGREAASADPGTSITVVSDPDVHGWMEMALSQAPPVMAETGESTAWMLFDGGNLLRFSTQSGRWNSYTLDGLGEVVDFQLCGDSPVLLTEDRIHIFDEEQVETVSETLPEGFDPVEFSVSGEDLAVLGADGGIAVMNDEGFSVYRPEEQVDPAGFLQKVGPDWIYMLQGGGLVFFDPTIALWQFEESPAGEMLTSSSNILFLGMNDSILVRTAPGEWTFHAGGKLFDGGLVLNPTGVSSIMSPGDIIADSPAIAPSSMLAMEGFREPIWAMDDLGMTVYSSLGMVETSLPYYETQRVSCSMAGQGSGGMQGSPASVSDMIQSGGGTFRIYESVSIRPDPFTEFSTETRDARRDLETISVEEFRLVGITLDPVGGDQAMVEDGIGVPYVIYEGTVLANNSHVAEITSNEVIVIQDVIVDYSARGGGETTIPTIYSLRLHEEGGL
ncbi:MAG: hypothetical protein AVO35_11485 [Candidatus Aegiribacteria sp. MLS_C]|nr:MAG: hypothetical protein AVO35_11485 [Candidatus Aegiribacteria sp. MLS_C]